jgi:hypothetical protein
MNISKMTISEAYPHLSAIAKTHNLRLNYAKEFKLARLILANLYFQETAFEFYD